MRLLQEGLIKNRKCHVRTPHTFSRWIFFYKKLGGLFELFVSGCRCPMTRRDLAGDIIYLNTRNHCLIEKTSLIKIKKRSNKHFQATFDAGWAYRRHRVVENLALSQTTSPAFHASTALRCFLCLGRLGTHTKTNDVPTIAPSFTLFSFKHS